MRILLTGGSACGKSSYAERLAVYLPGPRLYVATMRPYGPESLRKIERHREMRRHKGFRSEECYGALTGLRVPEKATVLLECMCNLTANRMFDEAGRMRDAYGDILRDVAHLEAQSANLIVVTNDVGSDMGDYSEATLRYVDMLGRLNMALAARFERVAELVCGIPIARKGALLMEAEKGETRDMVLIIGAAASGKRSYAQSLGFRREDMADGVLDGRDTLCNLQDLVAKDPTAGRRLLDALLTKKCVICNEVGSGVIPDEPAKRMAREETGRLCVLLAQRAKKVVRMVCGIPVVLKEEGAERTKAL